ncbi:MAG: M48 family metallopeptidase [Candidatus Omnitrophica bacterium]|nr:M48 family metallopeptidase [Candidatus Omnitrophota bacterium]
MKISRIFIIPLIIGSLLISGCATMYNPATEKKEIVFITTPMEVALGQNTAMQVAKQYAFIKDPQQVNKVTEIGEKLAKVSDRTDLKYHFAVVEDKEINAFTMPGGYIYINSGLLAITNDDELACVIGHEIGHVAARHIAKKLQTQLGYDILMNIALQNTSVRQMQQAIAVTFNLVELGYSRDDELLSDRLGAKYAYKAGYDPKAMITFLKKLKEKDQSDMGPVFLRSHPYASQRIQVMEKEIPVIISKVDAKTSQDISSSNSSNVNESFQVKAAAKPVQDEVSKLPTRVMCSKCRRIFPGTVKFCPYDGTKLE